MSYNSRFRRQFQGHVEREGSCLDDLSLTQPDMTMSIKEILLRFAQGLGAPASRPMFYGGDVNYPDLQNMSLTDQMDYYRSVVADVDAKQLEANRLRDARLKVINDNRAAFDEMKRKVAEYDAAQLAEVVK